MTNWRIAAPLLATLTAGVLAMTVVDKVDDRLFRGFGALALLGLVAWSSELWRKRLRARFGDRAAQHFTWLRPLVVLLVIGLALKLLMYFGGAQR